MAILDKKINIKNFEKILKLFKNSNLNKYSKE